MARSIDFIKPLFTFLRRLQTITNWTQGPISWDRSKEENTTQRSFLSFLTKKFLHCFFAGSKFCSSSEEFTLTLVSWNWPQVNGCRSRMQSPCCAVPSIMFFFIPELLRDGEVPTARAHHQARQEASAAVRQPPVVLLWRLLAQQVEHRRHLGHQGRDWHQEGNVRPGKSSAQAALPSALAAKKSKC